MTRRPSLPGASELFRLTSPSVLDAAVPAQQDSAQQNSAQQNSAQQNPAQQTSAQQPSAQQASGKQAPAADETPGPRRGTGRQKHSTKITVYVSDEELLALEHARLELRGGHGLAVDRGRVVREAIAIVLDDLEEHGHDSLLVRRLREQ
ncbi:hypothetical protein FHS29_005952 [Saccharothrix tamanrassetensis]|uniref:Cobyrinic acid a,c-diamide synthase n=1 Tax=Saccharothrix tamanrassetensis TaxID=1051531 RepID=A0A841CLG5_9PSEU|nr:hypothetical protein [Saccharothrix tamanrassetensis]MBB5959332.1 hypothetical protein [Saccharothrix tamanrassetensis]